MPPHPARPISVDILMCTFRRSFVTEALRSLARQSCQDHVQLRVIVADNDTTPSGQAAIEGMQAEFAFDLIYIHAPERNISIARNACLDAAEADWVAFIDDDETAPEDWIETLLAEANRTNADAMIAPALAHYPDSAPEWMVQGDYHSNHPVWRNGEVTTGHTCNALVRWAGTAWSDQRFDLARGRSGGEDTAFFFAIRAKGARLSATEKAQVYEPVDPKRLQLNWILRRKFRAGQSYASSADGLGARATLALMAATKALFCGACALATCWSTEKRAFWGLRASLHLGVIAGCLALPEPQNYGA